MLRRSALLIVFILALSMLPACTPPTVAYFPVRNDPGISLLLLNYGKLTLDNGLVRFKESGTGTSHLLIWPHGYSYRVSGNRVEVMDNDGDVVAKTGQHLRIGGGPASAVEFYTGEKPPVPLPGPYWALGGRPENMYPWDSGFWSLGLLMMVIGVCLLFIFLVIIRRRIKR